MFKNKISVVIITLNEAENIERCIRSVQHISDDIIIIDAYSSDSTAKIAEGLGAKVFIKKWIGYGQNKNFGNEYAKYDWILSIDADEVLSDSLIQSILELDLKQNVIYSMINQLNFCGKWINYTDWHPSYKKRLFNKTHTQWNIEDVHEGLIMHQDTTIQRLIGKMLHYGYTSISQLDEKTKHYAKLSASNLYKQHKKPSFFKEKLGPGFRFFKSYFLKLGFLDGKEGYIIAKHNSNLIKLRYQFLNKLYQSE